MQEIITALGYTASTMIIMTVGNIIIFLFIWINNEIRYKIAKHHGISRIFNILFFNEEEIKRNQKEFEEFMKSLHNK